MGLDERLRIEGFDLFIIFLLFNGFSRATKLWIKLFSLEKVSRKMAVGYSSHIMLRRPRTRINLSTLLQPFIQAPIRYAEETGVAKGFENSVRLRLSNDGEA
jgi:hypothetical protein